MTKKEQELIKDADVGYHKLTPENPWYSSAVLRIKGYEVTIKREYVATLDEATKRLKERMAEAINEFSDD